MTDTDISQALPGPSCGHYVPEPDELERTLAGLGIERTDQHPEVPLEPEEDFELEGTELEGTMFETSALLHGMGRHLELPSGGSFWG